MFEAQDVVEVYDKLSAVSVFLHTSMYDPTCSLDYELTNEILGHPRIFQTHA